MVELRKLCLSDLQDRARQPHELGIVVHGIIADRRARVADVVGVAAFLDGVDDAACATPSPVGASPFAPSHHPVRA